MRSTTGERGYIAFNSDYFTYVSINQLYIGVI